MTTIVYFIQQNRFKEIYPINFYSFLTNTNMVSCQIDQIEAILLHNFFEAQILRAMTELQVHKKSFLLKLFDAWAGLGPNRLLDQLIAY